MFLHQRSVVLWGGPKKAFALYKFFFSKLQPFDIATVEVDGILSLSYKGVVWWLQICWSVSYLTKNMYFLKVNKLCKNLQHALAPMHGLDTSLHFLGLSPICALTR